MIEIEGELAARWRRRSNLFACLFMHQSRIEISNNTTAQHLRWVWGILASLKLKRVAHTRNNLTQIACTRRRLPSSFYNAIWWLRIVCVRLKSTTENYIVNWGTTSASTRHEITLHSNICPLKIKIKLCWVRWAVSMSCCKVLWTGYTRRCLKKSDSC